MCFSATASFAGVASVRAAGGVADRAARLFSTHRWVKAFGALALLAFGAAYYFYAQWFISVWCLFAALLSAVIYLHFAPRSGDAFHTQRVATRPATQTSN